MVFYVKISLQLSSVPLGTESGLGSQEVIPSEMLSTTDGGEDTTMDRGKCHLPGPSTGPWRKTILGNWADQNRNRFNRFSFETHNLEKLPTDKYSFILFGQNKG